jgi:hypothetical protein
MQQIAFHRAYSCRSMTLAGSSREISWYEGWSSRRTEEMDMEVLLLVQRLTVKTHA